MAPGLHRALLRLQHHLPLQARQQQLHADALSMHQRLLHSFVDRGRILDRDELFALNDNAHTLVAELAAKDLIVIDSRGNPIGAYPFTMEQRPYRVSINGFTVHAMCALDALSVSPMFKIPTVVESHCAVSSTPIRFRQDDRKLEPFSNLQDIYCAINWHAASQTQCCANSLCSEIVFIKGHDCAAHWRSNNSQHREIFTIADAVELGSAFFVPLI